MNDDDDDDDDNNDQYVLSASGDLAGAAVCPVVLALLLHKDDMMI